LTSSGDAEEKEKRKDEIVETELLKLAFLAATSALEGYPWSS